MIKEKNKSIKSHLNSSPGYLPLRTLLVKVSLMFYGKVLRDRVSKERWYAIYLQEFCVSGIETMVVDKSIKIGACVKVEERDWKTNVVPRSKPGCSGRLNPNFDPIPLMAHDFSNYATQQPFFFWDCAPEHHVHSFR